MFAEEGFGVCPTGKLSRPRAHVGGLAVIINVTVRPVELLRPGENDPEFLLHAMIIGEKNPDANAPPRLIGMRSGLDLRPASAPLPTETQSIQIESCDGVTSKAEPVVGFEPTTDGLQNRCSTTELNWRPSWWNDGRGGEI